MQHNLVGFGFGPIQAGLFAAEARRSGRFADIAIAEVAPELVAAVRRNRGRYAVNVAHRDGVDVMTVENVTLLDPGVAQDRARLESSLRSATEIATCLPSVRIYQAGGNDSVAAQIARALSNGSAPATGVYTAENNNHAAEILEQAVREAAGDAELRPVQFLNTVIGKMSQVITDPDEITRRKLTPIAPGFARAFLVEEFNHILTSRIELDDFSPGISVFEQKPDLLPFEEAKLFGHNAIHTLLGFLGRERGCTGMAQLREFPEAMELARRAFVCEIGTALRKRHADVDDPLFTPEGFRDYAEDLLERMTNPHLNDAVARIVRDPIRKLGCNDRVFGPIRLCLQNGIEPQCLAAGAQAGLKVLLDEGELDGSLRAVANPTGDSLTKTAVLNLLEWLWGDDFQSADADPIAEYLQSA